MNNQSFGCVLHYLDPFYGGWFQYEKEIELAKQRGAGKSIHTISFEKLKLVSVLIKIIVNIQCLYIFLYIEKFN